MTVTVTVVGDVHEATEVSREIEEMLAAKGAKVVRLDHQQCTVAAGDRGPPRSETPGYEHDAGGMA